MFSVIKKALGVGHKEATRDPFYPTHYFRCQVMVWMVKNRQQVWYNKRQALEANYGIEEESATFKGL